MTSFERKRRCMKKVLEDNCNTLEDYYVNCLGLFFLCKSADKVERIINAYIAIIDTIAPGNPREFGSDFCCFCYPDGDQCDGEWENASIPLLINIRSLEKKKKS